MSAPRLNCHAILLFVLSGCPGVYFVHNLFHVLGQGPTGSNNLMAWDVHSCIYNETIEHATTKYNMAQMFGYPSGGDGNFSRGEPNLLECCPAFRSFRRMLFCYVPISLGGTSHKFQVSTGGAENIEITWGHFWQLPVSQQAKSKNVGWLRRWPLPASFFAHLAAGSFSLGANRYYAIG